MKRISLNDWIMDHSRAKAARIMGISAQAVYKMIEAGRNVSVEKRQGEWVFIETKELNR